jgi:hypothetical protein
MDDLSKYYTPLEKEVLSLVGYHLKLLDDKEKAGHHKEDYLQRTITLNKIRKQVRHGVKRRLEIEVEKKNRREEMSNDRHFTVCIDCQVAGNVVILEPSFSKEAGIYLDKVKCQACGSEFFNLVPKNPKEYKKAYDFIVRKLTDFFKDVKNREEFPDLYKGFPALKRKINKLKKLEKNAKEIEKQIMLNDKNLETHLTELKDILIMEKMESLQWGKLDKYLN